MKHWVIHYYNPGKEEYETITYYGRDLAVGHAGRLSNCKLLFRVYEYVEKDVTLEFLEDAKKLGKQ